MTENVVPEELWLPADFLDDGYILEEPIGNRKGSETESDDDYLIAGVTRQMARSFVHEGNNNPKVLATSPQSTLSGLRSWSFSSNNCSPDEPSPVSSPPSIPFENNNGDALDLLSEAADGPSQVVRLGLRKANRHHFSPEPSQSLIQQKLQAAQVNFYRLKREQQLTAIWRRQKAVRSGDSVGRPTGHPASALPPLQPTRQQPGAGMRAIFLNGSVKRRESAGTGVFLPRRAGGPPEPRKKQACSTVLLPERVVQTLNLNLDEVGVHPRFSGRQFVQDDGSIARNNGVHSQPKHQHRRSTVTATGPESKLPQEWTY